MDEGSWRLVSVRPFALLIWHRAGFHQPGRTRIRSLSLSTPPAQIEPHKQQKISDNKSSAAQEKSDTASAGTQRIGQSQVGAQGYAEEPSTQDLTGPNLIVNGDFSYPNVNTLINDGGYIFIDAPHSMYGRVGSDWVNLPGLSLSNFGWQSPDWEGTHNIVEIQNGDTGEGQLVDTSANRPNMVIYQDIDTVPGATYKWKIRQRSGETNVTDRTNILIGTPAAVIGKNPSAVQNNVRRTSVNGRGDTISCWQQHRHL